VDCLTKCATLPLGDIGTWAAKEVNGLISQTLTPQQLNAAINAAHGDPYTLTGALVLDCAQQNCVNQISGTTGLTVNQLLPLINNQIYTTSPANKSQAQAALDSIAQAAIILSAGQAVAGAGTAIGSVVTKAGSVIGDVATTVGTAIGDATTKAGTAIGDATTGALKNIGQVFAKPGPVAEVPPPPPLPGAQPKLVFGPGAAAAPEKVFHYTFGQAVSSIEKQGLRSGSYATPNGALSPLQAQIDLALPPNRGVPGALLQIDLAGLRKAGYEIPQVTQVGRSFGMPGGGFEMLFTYPIPPQFIKVIRP
jgi:hypothetical protein